MAKKKAKKKKRKSRWRILRRLFDIQPHENAFVPWGANQRPFAVVKESPMDFPSIEDLQKARSTLDEVVTVVKTGKPDGAALTALFGRLDDIGDLLLPADNGAGDSKTDRGVLTKALKALETLLPDVQSRDFQTADQVESVVTLIKDHLDGAGTESADGAEADDADGAEADDDAKGEESAAEAAASAEGASEGEATDTEATDTEGEGESEAAAAAEGSEAAGEAAEEATEGTEAAEVAEAEPADLAKVLEAITGLGERVNKLAEDIEGIKKGKGATKVGKGAPQQVPGTQPVYTRSQDGNVSPAEEQLLSMDLTQHPDLARITPLGTFLDE